MRSSSIKASVRLAIICIAAPGVSGCGMLYENSFDGPSFTLYSDRNPEYLSQVGVKVERIYEGFQDVFHLSKRDLGNTTIVLEGDDSNVIDYGYSPSLLGYYIPLFNFISVDTACAWAQGEAMLEQILLHEVSHHFIVTEFPAASQECWLNEGLAGALEVSLFDRSKFECALLNPLLFQVAQRAAHSSPKEIELSKFLELSWSEFHDQESKERNYALAWSIVYYLLERQMDRSRPIGDRIQELYRLDRKVIAELEPGWIAFLRGFDLAGSLLRLSRLSEEDALPWPGALGKLTARWAVEQMGTVRTLDDLRMLEGLTRLFDDPDDVKRALAFHSFLRVLERTQNSSALEEKFVIEGLDRLEAILEDGSEPPALRESLAIALGESYKTRRQWLPGLVQCLDNSEGGLRAAAARTLSRIAGKPTIVNPSFWVSGPLSAREREVAEWRHWLSRQDVVSEQLR
jgi:hypothetical protein